ncbi:hypothetical protein [Mesorhizobium sp. 113-3-3]|nr:hypothetical protein [Mesorhizobium sp. 113-3-3]
MDSKNEIERKDEDNAAERRARFWGWFWMVVATAAMYLLVWVTR